MNYSSIDVFVARWPLKLDFKSSILNVVHGQEMCCSWGWRIQVSPRAGALSTLLASFALVHAQQSLPPKPLQLPMLTTVSQGGVSISQTQQVSAITASQMKALSFSQFTAIATPLVKRYMTANVSATDILNYFLANPSVSDAQVVMAMDQLGVSPLQVANALSVPLSVVQVRYEASAGLVYANLQAPFVALFPTHWGLGINYTPTQIVNVALGLQANGATFLDIASDMYTLGVTPSQFRNAFLGINIAQ